MQKLLYLFVFSICLQHLLISQQIEIAKTAKDQLYIQTDKDYYLKGSTLFFKAYLSDQSGRLGTSKSEVIYVDLININGEIIETKTIKTHDGMGTGTFNLGFAKDDGKYLIRGYTNYMKNFDPRDFYRKVIFIENGQLDNANHTSSLATSKEIKFDMFPEGGYLATGLKSAVLIQATDENGNPTASTFDLMENDEKMSTHKTNENGCTKITLTPKRDTQYSISSLGKSYMLPQSVDKTVSLKVTITNEHVTVAVHSTVELNDYSLALIQGNDSIETINLQAKQSQDHDFVLNDMPTGNLRLAVLNPQKKIVTERYVFNHIGIDNYNVDFELDAESYDKRSLASISVDVYDDDGESLPGNYSLSIIDRSFNKTSMTNHSIRTNTLLSSGTRFNSIDPNALIIGEQDIDIELIDNFMIMYGNSSREIIEAKVPRFKSEKDMSLHGKIHLKKDPTQGVSASGEMYLLQSFLDVHSFRSDDDGHFTIPTNLDADSIDVLFKVGEVKKNKKTNKVEVKVNHKLDVTILSHEHPPVSKHSIDLLKKARPIEFQNPSKEKDTAITHIADENTIYKYEDLLRSQDYDGTTLSVQLEEVSIKAEKQNDDINFYKKQMLYSTPNSRIQTKDIPSIQFYDDIYSILRRLPSVQFDGPISGSGTKHTIILRGYSSGLDSGGSADDLRRANAAKFMLNGTFVSQVAIEAIRPSDIAFVDVISSLSQLTQFGETGVNGVIAVYLKTVEQDQRPKIIVDSDLIPQKIKGYHIPDLFEHKYYPSEQTDKYDSRTTIYWNPHIQIDESGNTIVEFFTADRYTTYDVILEGITDDGLPVRAISEIQVSK